MCATHPAQSGSDARESPAGYGSNPTGGGSFVPQRREKGPLCGFDCEPSLEPVGKKSKTRISDEKKAPSIT